MTYLRHIGFVMTSSFFFHLKTVFEGPNIVLNFYVDNFCTSVYTWSFIPSILS